MADRLQRKRFVIRWIRRGCAFLLLAGLTGFQLHVRHRDPDVIQIADIRPYMNFSVIAVQGTLASDPLHLRNGSTLYRVDDGSGVIAVFYEAPGKTGPAQSGDRIRAAGCLNVGAGKNVRLQVRSSDGIVLDQAFERREFPGGTGLTDIAPDLQGSFVTVTGCVRDVRIPAPDSRAPYHIILTDGMAQLDTVNWFEHPPEVSPGDWVVVTGRVQMYRGRVQLRLLKGTGIRPFD